MIIGLAGKAGVGKTTVARLLEEREGFVIRSYAYPLKKALSALTGLSMEYFMDIRLKEQIIPWIGKTPRQLMQTFGTDYIRKQVHEDFWVRRMHQTLMQMDSSVNVVIDDCRFENETGLVRGMGGYVIHLRRAYEIPTTEVNHESERNLKIHDNDVGIMSGEYGPETTYKYLMAHLDHVMGNDYAHM